MVGWLGDIRTYFPSTVVQVMQRDAIERLNLQQLLLEPELLDAVEPDVNLVATLIGPGGIAVGDNGERAPGQVLGIRPAVAFEFERLGPGRIFSAGAGVVGIAAVGADQPVDHQLEAGRRVIPVHRTGDEDCRAPPPSVGRARPSSRWSARARGSGSTSTASGRAAAPSRRRPCRDR